MKKNMILTVLLVSILIACHAQMDIVPEKSDTLHFGLNITFIFIRQWDTTPGFGRKYPEYDTTRIVRFLSKYIDSVNTNLPDSCKIKQTLVSIYVRQMPCGGWCNSFASEISSIYFLTYHITDTIKVKRYFSEEILPKDFYKIQKWFPDKDLKKWMRLWSKTVRKKLNLNVKQ